MTIDDLHPEEKLAFGGLLRMMIRADGSFSEEEENQIERVAAEIGGRDALWHAVSRSAQEHEDDAAIRSAADHVKRPEARKLILDALQKIAEAEGVEVGEQALLDWLRAKWK